MSLAELTVVTSLAHLLGRSLHDMTLGVVFTTLQLPRRCVTSMGLHGMDSGALLVAGCMIGAIEGAEADTAGMWNWVKFCPGGGVRGGVSMQPWKEGGKVPFVISIS